MSQHHFVAQVRIVRQSGGWSRTIVDTPHFYLLSDAQFGSVYTKGGAEDVARAMFAPLMLPDDEIYVTTSPVDLPI